MNKPIEIFFATDNNFVQHLCVAIASILKNANEDDYFNFYILGNKLKQNDIKNIENLRKIKDFNLEIIEINDELFKRCKSPNYINSISTFFRYLIPVLKPELDKILYLDCDIVVKKSLKELYNTNIDNYYLAGVEDIHILCTESKLKPMFAIDEPYLNAGVLLFNCKMMRDNNFTDKCVELTNDLNTRCYYGADQDVINIITQGYKKVIDIKYNVISAIFSPTMICTYSQSSIDNALSNPVIIHFTDRKKPWNIKYYPQNKFFIEYYRYLKLTPYFNKKIYSKLIFKNNNFRLLFRKLKDNFFLKVVGSFFDLFITIFLILISPINGYKLVRNFKKEVENV